MLLPPVERLGVEHDVGAEARLGAGDVALSPELHPGHREDRPERGAGDNMLISFDCIFLLYSIFILMYFICI